MWNIKPVRRSFGLCACSLALVAAACVVSAQAQQQMPAPVDCGAGIPGTDLIVEWSCPAGCKCLAPLFQFNPQGLITAMVLRCGC